jgi:two-component system, OmpR family, sensor histidine kinase SenX3
MVSASRRKLAIFFLIFGICLVALTVALNVGWILLSLEQIALLVFGIIFFALIITGLVLNTIFLFREFRRNEQHDAFINAVTHELKTPIASIRLYLETLKTREVSEEKRQEFYKIMLADNDRLLNTVEQVLQAGRFKTTNLSLNSTEINLNELLTESINRIQTRYDLPESAINLMSSVGETYISGDADELQSAFINLLDNSVKYSGDEIKILINVKNLNKDSVIIRIKDSGIGIPPSELKRIFHRFYRVSNRATQTQKGTGLGLFIVKAIINRHGGKIIAESEGEGKGSKFIIQLPKSKNENSNR